MNEEMQIPYVSKELCEYLREVFSLPNILADTKGINAGEYGLALGFMNGVDHVIKQLEAINVQQGEHDGIY